ncbi:shTK domain protein, partial [Ostertagia ostertagi]
MHYDSHAFGRMDPSTHTRLVTMIPLKKGVTLDDNLKMSENDIAKLNRLGNCTVSKESHKEGNSSTCIDTALNCERLKKNGLCSSSSHLQAMLKYCPKTCHLCGLRSADPSRNSNSSLTEQPFTGSATDSPVPACHDEDPRCDTYAMNGFCTNPFYAQIRATKCMKTCNLCISIEETD